MSCKHRSVSAQVLSLMVFTGLLLSSLSAQAQDSTATGSAGSVSPNTNAVSSGERQYPLYVLGRNVRKPDSLMVGSQGARVASRIPIEQPQARNVQEPRDSSVVPAQVREVESDIEREVRRFQVGVRAGVALDSELAMVGVQGQVGPFFRDGVYFRPSVEFGLGEVTAMFGFNGDFIYRLPFSARDRWSTYFGAGIGLNLLHQSFEGEEDGRRIDFGDFHSDTALNILGGVRRRSGVFLEMKTSVYSGPSPTLRMTVGYTF
jgi:hypothetical protein